MPGERRYWAFLSYAHADAKMAARLHGDLERFRVPAQLVGKAHPLGLIPARLTPVFRDRQELAAASNLGREIAEALDRSNYFIVLCSPAAARSKWVDQEIREFQRLHGPERILAAILDGEPSCGEDGRECFPPALREEGAEPIAADLRAAGDGWRGGFLKIVAGMLDVGLDDLVQRDQQRRHKRMAWIASASLVGMAATSGLAVFAIDQRDAARVERREAEGLVEYMLGDLKGALEPIGKLEALDGVGARILDYYSRQDTADLDDAGLLQRARALSLTAQVAYQRVDLDAAYRLYRQALASTGEAIDRDPADPQRLYDHAQNVFWLGEIARQHGQPERAEAANWEYQRLANRMVALDPTNLKWRMETVYAAENIAIALYNRRRFAEAARRIEAALGPMSAMASAYPGNAEYQRELSTVLAWLADARRDEGRLKDATAARERQIAVLSKQLDSGTTNVRLQEQLIPARQALGILLTAQGRGDEGVEQLRLSIAEAERLIPVEPDNAMWTGYATGVRLELGSTLLSLGRNREAAAETKAGCELMASLRTRDPDGSTWRNDQTSCLMNRALLALNGGSPADAIALAERALESARTERSVDPFKSRYRMAAAYRLIGDIRRRSGDGKAARLAWTAGLAQLPSNVTERPREIRERSALLERLGRTAEARAYNDRLKAIGYLSTI